MSTVFIIFYTLLSTQGRRRQWVCMQGLYYVASILNTYIIVYVDIRHRHIYPGKVQHYTREKIF